MFQNRHRNSVLAKRLYQLNVLRLDVVRDVGEEVQCQVDHSRLAKRARVQIDQRSAPLDQIVEGRQNEQLGLGGAVLHHAKDVGHNVDVADLGPVLITTEQSRIRPL